MEWKHITDHDLERYYLGMVRDGHIVLDAVIVPERQIAFTDGLERPRSCFSKP